jgi:tRNA(Ile)-lysidine synthase
MTRRAHPERNLEQLIGNSGIAPDGATLLVACSGGPDSVALASLVARVAPRHNWRIVLGHVNHHIRESSWQDEAVVLSIAARLSVPLEIAALDSGGHADEASLREGRYAALVDLAKTIGSTTIVTAHVAEDQTETVLLALFRGTGLRGLRGIPVRRRLGGAVDVVRPLLQVGHEALRAELAASALPYVSDPTNTNIAYRRNAIRAALESLRDGFPRLDEAVARCAAIVAAELEAGGAGDARRRLRRTLEREVGLRDVSFERIEAALGARRGRVHIKAGVEILKGEKSANTRVVRRKD